MDNIKTYAYVGSEELKLSVSNCPSGIVINSISELKEWIAKIDRKSSSAFNLIVATFVIDLFGNLCLAERHSEHVACAGGQPVLSAGEIFITWERDKFEISEISNQSTGYCPEIESWEYVKKALDKIQIDYPSHFTSRFIFRRCTRCHQINIIKDSLFICQVCSSNLLVEKFS